VVSWSIALLANDALPTFTTEVALVDEAAACIVAAPPSMPDTAAATIKVFIECFIRCHSSVIFPGPRPGIDGAGGRPAVHKNMGRIKGYSIL
jgi:hypothetical protein